MIATGTKEIHSFNVVRDLNVDGGRQSGRDFRRERKIGAGNDSIHDIVDGHRRHEFHRHAHAGLKEVGR